MKYFIFIFLFTVFKIPIPVRDDRQAKLVFEHDQLRNKIRGGWAGQTIGVTFGHSTSCRFNDMMINDSEIIPWHKGYLKETFDKNPDVYAEVYLDLTFVQVLEKEGFNAPVNSFARAYTSPQFVLTHANQTSRYNILNGIEPPSSGHWLNNPHADDIDFQIEADFAGLMSPGMPRTAAQVCDKIGHMMSYGDGYYGGLYIANLYALAFADSKIDRVVEQAIKSIPDRTDFHRCISDVIKWHKLYPQDWKRTWFEIQKEWAKDIGCPDGVDNVFDTDAKLNAAYVTLGLLYGNGDFSKTLEITTRAGQNSGSNPSASGGILGVLLGYDKIPDFWKQDIPEVESIPFKYTSMSLKDACDASYKQALKMIERNGGKVKNGNITIPVQRPLVAKFEKNFEGHYPIEKRCLENQMIDNQFEFDFEGIGFVLAGETTKANDATDYIAEAELYINNKYIEKFNLPSAASLRRSELCWKYQLPYGKHRVKIVILNPSKRFQIKATDVIVYDVHTH